MEGNRITTHTDRLWHMEKCRNWDIEWTQEHGGSLPSEQHYENVGDIATVQDWCYQDPTTRFLSFYANTPDWITGIAARRCWSDMRGELMLCVHCSNQEYGCAVCCPEVFAGGAV